MLNELLCGQYRVEGKLREEGFWTYFRGIDTRSETIVEIQAPSLELYGTADIEARLEEIKTKLASLKVEGLPTWLAACRSQESLVLITKPIPGKLLSERIHTAGQLSIDEAIDLGLGLSRILSALREAGIVQGVLHPAWIVFPEDTNQPVVKHPGLGSLLGRNDPAASLEDLRCLAAPELTCMNR